MKVSVVIPTYNRAYIIKDAVNSVLNQTYPIHELIIVDDGSTDDTVELLTKMSNEKIKIINNKYEKGANGARNTGIDFATGDYIAFQDSDDIWRNDKIKKQLDFLEQNSEYDFCFCSFNTGTDRGIAPNRKVESTEVFDLLHYRNFISTQTMFMKAEVAKNLKFLPHQKKYQDWEFIFRVAKNYKIGHVNEVLVDAEIQENSISKTQNHIESTYKIMQLNPEFRIKSPYTKKIYYVTHLKYAVKNKKIIKSIRYFLPSLYFYILVKGSVKKYNDKIV